MLHRPKDVLISSCMWFTKKWQFLENAFRNQQWPISKNMSISLCLAQLSNWTHIVGAKFMAITCSLGGSGNDCMHTSFSSNTALHRRVDFVFSNNNFKKYDGGFSKSRKKLANDPIVCLNPPYTNREQNEQTRHHRIQVQSFLQCQPKGLIFIYKYIKLCTPLFSSTTLHTQSCV